MFSQFNRLNVSSNSPPIPGTSLLQNEVKTTPQYNLNPYTALSTIPIPAKPRTPSPFTPSLQSSLSSLASDDNFVPAKASSNISLLAMKRFTQPDGTRCLTLVNVKTGKRFTEQEFVLNASYNIGLGDFMTVDVVQVVKKKEQILLNFVRKNINEYGINLKVDSDNVFVSLYDVSK
uniref:Uncharacterized protein n=1 Tax=Caenorhabditis japonica TaxID=281687 RepID=A0A8R1IEK0_CAEJA